MSGRIGVATTRSSDERRGDDYRITPARCTARDEQEIQHTVRDVRSARPARPVMVDLFCKAGGATKGYQRAGFYVIGVDIEPQPNYCGDEFIQADALVCPLDRADAIHASPPCQAYSVAARYTGKDYPDLLGATRERLDTAGVPWIIENVPGAPMRADYRICGCMVGLPRLRRVRWFETSWQHFEMSPPCQHTELAVTVCGHGTPSWTRQQQGRNMTVADWRDAMGIDWMNRAELAQAIPPAYTEHIGRQLMAHLTHSRAE
jgi:DNA (cytosine-5)-methyltransferase 1